MREVQSLTSLCPIIIRQVAQELANDPRRRKDLKKQLEEFFPCLELAVETGDSKHLDVILSKWASSLTHSDMVMSSNDLVFIINKMMLVSVQVFQKELDQEQAITLINATLPHFAFAVQKVARFENQIQVDFLLKELHAAQKNLERQDKKKSDFVTVIGHEFKTPLSLVEGYTDIFEESLEGQELTSDQKLYLNGVHNGLRRLHSLINDIIDVSLIDNHLLRLNYQPYWLVHLFTALKSEFEESVKARNLELEIVPFWGQDEMAYGDPDRLLQVFKNVLSNSIKYTPDGGKIIISGRKLPNYVEITFKDSGIGIDVEDQTLIFDKFSLLEQSTHHSSGKTKFKGGGPGLGLHIAKGIIETHGGTIWVESPGCDEIHFPGSTFHILIPLFDSPEENPSFLIYQPFPSVKQDKEEHHD